MAVSAKKVGLHGTVGFLVAALIIVGVVISGVEMPGLRPNTGTLIIKVTDAPVKLEQLDITIDSVSAHRVESDAWIPMDFVGKSSEVTFDLLELDDKSMDLCITDVSPGKYNMIKIHIDEANAVYTKEDTESEDNSGSLRVPSEAIRVIVHFEVQDNGETAVLIDIEPDWVAISESNNLRPVLKATVISEEGPE